LILGGDANGSISFADATVSNVDNLVVTTTVFVPSSVPFTVDLGDLKNSLETVTFEEAVTVQAKGSITISNAPETGTMTFDKGATVDGLLGIQDVKTLTLDVGTTFGFSFGTAGAFEAADLTDLTIDLGKGSSFTGVTASTGTDVNKLTDVTVTGDSSADFTMDFDTQQSGAIAAIDLSAFSGDATINVFSVVAETAFGPIDVTLGDGNLVYTITESGADTASAEDFIFSEAAFGTADITGFEIGGGANSDDLDLSELGVTSGAQLEIVINDDADMVISSKDDDFTGVITLVGTFDLNDVTTVAALNIIYA
jgi:hypothetical protein